VTFPTSEHAYQWAKTLDPGEKDYILHNYSDIGSSAIAFETTPGVAKRRGKEITLRSDWSEVRYGIMVEIQRAKFTQHCGLRQKLQETGDAILIEGNNWHDNTWGECSCDGCKNKEKQNLLGKALMQVRDELAICAGRCFSTNGGK
jgi:ribA/ribD-fused uncharacterized protein